MLFSLSTTPNSISDMKDEKNIRVEQKTNAWISIMIYSIYLLLVSFGIVSLAEPGWLRSVSNVGQASEAIVMQYYGDYFLNNQEFEMAVAQYNRAIAINPQMSEAYINLGVALKFLKDYDQALETFDKALKFEGVLHDATYYNMAEIHLERNKPDMAIYYYLKAAAVSPFPLQSYQKAGELLNNAAQWSQAFESFNKAIENAYTLENCFAGMMIRDFYLFDDPAVKKEIKSLESSGIENIDLSSYDEKIFNDALQRNPQIASIYNQFGYTYAMTENYEKAINCFNIALQIKPDFQNARSNLNAALNILNQQGGGS